MSTLTIASIETTIGKVFHSVAAEAAKIAAGLHLVVADVDKAAPMIETVISAINPAAGLAAKAVIGIIDTVDAAVTSAQTDAAGGVTVTVPAELVALFKQTKTAVTAYESAL